MRVWKDGRRKTLSRICCLLVLFCIFAAMSLCLANGAGARAWQADSEEWVWGRISRARSDGLLADAMLMRRYDDLDDRKAFFDGAAPGREPDVYTGQSGLQGTCFAAVALPLLALGLPASAVGKLLWYLNSALFIVVFGLLCAWIRGEAGWAAAIGAASCAILAPWVVRSTPNLYWVTWTMLLPMVLTAYWARRCADGGGGRWFGVALFAAMLARFMCGFEFTSTIMLASEIPALYYMVRRWRDAGARRAMLVLMVKIGLIELGAFVLAVGLLFVQLLAYRQWNVDAARMDFLERVAKRTGFMADQVEVPAATLESLAASRLDVVRSYLFSTERIYLHLPLMLLTALTAATELARAWLAGEKMFGSVLRIAFLGVCLLPAVSWFALASAHAYVHTHICYILYFFPYLPAAAAMLCKNGFEMVGMLRNCRDDVR